MTIIGSIAFILAIYLNLYITIETIIGWRWLEDNKYYQSPIQESANNGASYERRFRRERQSLF